MQIEAIREVGRRIRARREAAGESVTAFAARSDLDRVYLGKLERGLQNPTLLVLARIAVELQVELDELLAGIVVDPDEIRAVRRLTRGPAGTRSAPADPSN